MSAAGKPDIVLTLQSEGMELRQRGRNFWGLCPFHVEKTASFKADPDKQSFHCFGCGAHGDVIGFIQHRHSLDFKAALSYLGISSRPLDAKARQRIADEKRKREAVRAFREWCHNYFIELASLVHKLDQAKLKARPWADVERLAIAYHEESRWSLHLEILQGRDETAKIELYRREGIRHAA